MARIFLTHAPDMLANYYGDEAVAGLGALGELVINPTGRVLGTADLIAAAQGCQIIVSDRQTPGEAAVFRELPELVAFLRGAVDIRTVDVAAASAAGVLVTRASPGFVAAVAELAVGFMIDLGRHVSRAAAEYHGGTPAVPRLGRQLKGSTLGIIGYGVIGRHLAGLAAACGMTILVNDPYVCVAEPAIRQVELDALLEAADFVVCLALATPATENLMNAERFARMRRDAYFINLSRGNLVDEAALARALDEGKIAGAAMDVGRAADQMPSLALAQRPTVLATPHIGGLTPPAIAHQALETVAQTAVIVTGKVPPGAVNAEAATRLARLRR